MAVADWRAMLQQVRAAIERLEAGPPGVAAGELRESIAFLRWLEAGNFTFLGVRDYRLDGTPETGNLVPVEKAGLGVLRDPAVQVLRRGTELVDLTPEIRRFYFAPAPLIITKSNVVSRVHRRVHMDYIGIKTYRADGTLDGEMRIVGLFTSQAYTGSPRDIPFLRHKVETVLKMAGYPAASHAGKALMNVLETFPRDELFQIEVERAAARGAEGILDLETRPRVRVFARIDRFDRFVSAARVRAARPLHVRRARAHRGPCWPRPTRAASSRSIPTSPTARWCGCSSSSAATKARRPQVEIAELERGIADIVRTWDDRLAEAIAGRGAGGEALLAKYRGGLLGRLRGDVPRRARAARTSAASSGSGPDLPVAIDFYREHGRAGGPLPRRRLPLRRADQPVGARAGAGEPGLPRHRRALLPDQAALRRRHPGRSRCTTWCSRPPTARRSTSSAHDKRLEACFLAVFRGDADNDSFNRLIVAAGADWRAVAALRAYAAYLRQLGSPFGPRYIADTLNRHAGVARDLLELFHLRFDPARKLDAEARSAAEGPIRERIEGALAAVPSLDEDRILRLFLNLIGATVRTNFFQAGADGRAAGDRSPSSSTARRWMPRRSRARSARSGSIRPRVEGIHLRFAPIARGGIRWSDRAQDFRTEVLGLVRAQLVKNAVIVPSGAKGGFLPKQLPRGGSRDEIQKEGVAAYRIFISALLDITDNIKDGKIVPPPRVVRHDGDDPYLVVAADKGTATFSDIANEISHRARFLAGRRLRLRRLGRLRPQADGDHRARRLGVRQAPLPRDGHRHPAPAVPRGRRRRHVGRRVRQRHAAVGAHPAGGGLRPSRHLHRSRARRRRRLRRAQAPVRAAALELAGLRQGQDLQGRRRVLALGQVDCR